MQISTKTEDHLIAKLAALAIALHVLEAVFPSPLPGVKPGIANIVVLFVYYQYGFQSAVWVSLLRVLAGSLLFGQFLSPTFILSLSGALVSLLVIWLVSWMRQPLFSAVAISILAAFGHIAGQMLVVRYWLIPHASAFALVPVFAAAALFFGLINGLIVNQLLQSFARYQQEEPATELP